MRFSDYILPLAVVGAATREIPTDPTVLDSTVYEDPGPGLRRSYVSRTYSGQPVAVCGDERRSVRTWLLDQQDPHSYLCSLGYSVQGANHVLADCGLYGFVVDGFTFRAN